MDKFQNKYRIQSTRLQNWNYGWGGAYFITVCTEGRECYFGNVINGKMQLSETGIIADILWHEIKNHATNIELGAFVVMPNHVHGILILDGNGKTYDVGTTHVVETTHALSLQQPGSGQSEKTIGQTRFQNQGKNTISSIIGAYKSAVSKHAHRLGFGFGWQSRFHDHIIRDEQSYRTISEYIINNPLKWDEDKFNPCNTNTGQ
ncbi:MAG: transposase [Bacteroidetes bacterium GWF2_42_66]|nr:MAG: transposase [Bacteroidetes bacterium GWA2_42_15]OFY01422.1 MAG: transposase [Bacteroidetes bacterium GWE2_42_39]OFY42263.1 MAG: transposase [Bacteroidetes bacterium GWF2_42_66]HBL77577.1 transposase [Prolixibacteraceae bacterium]HCB62707.1 transposase [Bacteroidales bacterium]